ncbi:hypothetical protein [Sphingobacterium faecium]|uniref:hypothetical protein n=1 Tax=Sphingobacterium faecium TaxID=34087 RepID=UPI0032096ADD
MKRPHTCTLNEDFKPASRQPLSYPIRYAQEKHRYFPPVNRAHIAQHPRAPEPRTSKEIPPESLSLSSRIADQADHRRKRRIDDHGGANRI